MVFVRIFLWMELMCCAQIIRSKDKGKTAYHPIRPLSWLNVDEKKWRKNDTSSLYLFTYLKQKNSFYFSIWKVHFTDHLQWIPRRFSLFMDENQKIICRKEKNVQKWNQRKGIETKKIVLSTMISFMAIPVLSIKSFSVWRANRETNFLFLLIHRVLRKYHFDFSFRALSNHKKS